MCIHLRSGRSRHYCFPESGFDTKTRYLEFGVIDLRWLPFSIHIVIPILGLLGIRVGDMFWLLPVLGLLVLWVIDRFTFIPVFGFLGVRILE